MSKHICPILYAGVLANPSMTSAIGGTNLRAMERIKCLGQDCQMWQGCQVATRGTYIIEGDTRDNIHETGTFKR